MGRRKLRKNRRKRRDLFEFGGPIAYTRRGAKLVAWKKAKSWSPSGGEPEAVRKARELLEGHGRDN